jgi:hypothetical protein
LILYFILIPISPRFFCPFPLRILRFRFLYHFCR